MLNFFRTRQKQYLAVEIIKVVAELTDGKF
jgi:hypothetical protein